MATDNTGGNTNTVNKTFEELMAANLEASGKLAAKPIVLLVRSVSDWKPTIKGNLPRKMVITDKGTFWMLASNITNLPTSFTQPVQATAVISQNGQYLNMNKLEFPGLETTTLLSIRELPAGTALFSTAIGIKLAI